MYNNNTTLAKALGGSVDISKAIPIIFDIDTINNDISTFNASKTLPNNGVGIYILQYGEEVEGVGIFRHIEIAPTPHYSIIKPVIKYPSSPLGELRGEIHMGFDTVLLDFTHTYVKINITNGATITDPNWRMYFIPIKGI